MASEKIHQNPELSVTSDATLQDFLMNLKSKIAKRATEIAESIPGYFANDDGKNNILFPELAKATDEVIHEYPTSEKPFRFFELFPPFTCICSFLCLAFAILGLVPGSSGISESTKSGFLDIAKIFAGAIVGSTTSIALKSNQSKHVR